MPTAVTDFVPADLDATSWANVEPLFDALSTREIGSGEELERWLIDRGELEAACSETRANLYISMTCDTDDADKAQAYKAFVENVAPKLKPACFELDKRQVELTERFGLDASRYGVLMRDTAAAVALFREENVPLETQLDTLSQEYQTVTGAMGVEFDGEEKTLPQMGKYQESPDRKVREEAWRVVASRRLQDKDKIDAIYDQQIALRDQIAKNAGFDDYVGYIFKAMRRFDYTPADCIAFHDAVEQSVVPLKRRLDEERRERLGVDTLRPWDLGVDPLGRTPLQPFSNGVELVSKTHECLRRLDPRLAAMFAELGDGSNDKGSANGACLDLDSRRGKAPGGYQYMRDRSRVPFIFMNAAGLHRDVETMVHEAGHAFHSMLSREDPLLHYREAPIEYCEVASMSMELLTMPHWNGAPGSYYDNEEDANRARRRQIEGSVVLLAWIATIDAFQHWIYTNPGHSRDERIGAWLEIDDRFGHAVSWDGLADEHKWLWQRQSHLWGHAFYYIEYGIAQLGALQLWVHALEQGAESAISNYIRGLTIGGARPLPDLFEATGLRFDFSGPTIANVTRRVEAELAKLPE